MKNSIEEIKQRQGDILKLSGSDGFRYKKPPYRILFTMHWEDTEQVFTITEINTIGDIKY